MYRTTISLTDRQRDRLKALANAEGRSTSNMIARLVDLEFETRTAYQEREPQTAGAQNPEPGNAPQGQGDEIE